ncbi:MAG: biotin--[acetyl-CoA-carboxylase] ligase [Thermodesulfobacteriota bacterium]|nr:biotin--[acetyl-CoA-carboxylase] ligase [Thermodesulfobacteriota bacterium]
MKEEKLWDGFHLGSIKNNLKTSYIGKKIYYYDVTDSTNIKAKELAMDGEKEGSIILAEAQTAGRGRLKRKWLSPKGSNILLSVILRPRLELKEVFLITMVASVAIAKIVRSHIKLAAEIKWPNDIYIKGKKVCGILTEFNTEKEIIDFIVLGVGINVNFNTAFYPEIKEVATSLSMEKGKKISRNKLLLQFLFQLEKEYEELKRKKVEELRKSWCDYSCVLGKNVTIESFGTIYYGKALNIDKEGSLIIQNKEGQLERILSGDVQVKSISP